MQPPATLIIDGQTFTFDLLITQAQINETLGRFAAAIDAADYPDGNPVVITILRGARPTTDALTKLIQRPIDRDELRVSSYSGTTTTGKLEWLIRPNTNLTGRHVILVEDIVDTGLTMDAVVKELGKAKPASLQIVTLLHKPSRTKVKTDLWQVGFTIEDHFVIGFGLDYEQQFRDLPDIYRLVK